MSFYIESYGDRENKITSPICGSVEFCFCKNYVRQNYVELKTIRKMQNKRRCDLEWRYDKGEN
jgi:hypothetical protein